MVLENISAPAVRQQLARILAHEEFAQSERMCRFLRLVVEYSLENRAHELKEYLVGVEVFDRKTSYDPRLDPIVRVEARRLRAKLQKYYEGEGRLDDVVIELPKGSYAAIFTTRGNSAKQDVPVAPDGTIAVLPFSNLSAEEENEYFSDGLTQELIHGLTRVDGLRVVAWNSAAQLKGAAHDIHAIGRQLKVGAVLTGSVRKAGNRVRIAVQLIDAATNVYLWSETYDRKLEDLFQIQDEISCAIVGTLRIKLAGRLPPPVSSAAVRNTEAHNLYLKGRFHWNKRTSEGLQRAVGSFEQAIALDPEFALGWAGLADAYTLLVDYGLMEPLHAMPRAKEAATRALAIDPSLAEAWASLALIRSLYEWEWADAGACYDRAIDLNPGYATVRHWHAVDYLAMLGRLDEALPELKLAREMDPWSTIIIEGCGFVQMLSRRYNDAIRTYREVLELDPYFYKSYSSIGRALIQQGKYKDAIESLEKGRSLGGDLPNILGALGQAHALAGHWDEARALLEKLDVVSRTRYVPSTCSAIIHLGLGENQRALDLLEIGCEHREIALVGIKVHPVYDDLRGEPRFIELLRRLHLD